MNRSRRTNIRNGKEKKGNYRGKRKHERRVEMVWRGRLSGNGTRSTTTYTTVSGWDSFASSTCTERFYCTESLVLLFISTQFLLPLSLIRIISIAHLSTKELKVECRGPCRALASSPAANTLAALSFHTLIGTLSEFWLISSIKNRPRAYYSPPFAACSSNEIHVNPYAIINIYIYI